MVGKEMQSFFSLPTSRNGSLNVGLYSDYEESASSECYG